LIKLPLLEEWIDRRREIAARYSTELEPLGFAVPRDNSHNRHVYYIYVVEHSDRDRIMSAIKERGIQTNISYPYPVHTMRGYEMLGYRQGQFPVTEAKAKSIFSLPMYPYLAEDEIEYVIETLRRVLNG
jgi:aminotransferase EvaB